MAAIEILILDDDPDDVFLVVDTLDDVVGTRYINHCCSTTAEALDVLARQSIDLIICDYRLGAETGTQFIADLPERGFDVPTILLTGMADSEADRLALEAGAADFISKANLSPSLLDRTIRYAIANSRRQALLSSVVDSVSAAICVADTDSSPAIWNSHFEALALRHHGGEDRTNAIATLMQSALEDSAPRNIADKVCDTTVTRLDDGRRVVTMHDVSEHARALEERERAVERADHMAMHCSLTGLPNRAALTHRLEHAVAKADAGGTGFTVVILDLDRFKEINDVHGHQAGDKLLQEYSHRMNRCCGNKEFLGRMGGDEFVMVCESSDRGEGLISRLETVFADPFSIEGRQVFMRASIGLADYPEHGRNVGDLLSNADTAMFRSKANGNVPYLRYNSEIDQQTRYRRRLLVDLKEAVEADVIEPHFQPQVCSRSGKLRGFEALARWHDPERGYVPPFEFIELAENNGFIDIIGRSILRKACQEAVSWPNDLMVCVNISAAQISDPGFARLVHSTLLETGLPATRLELEVTETVLIDDFDKALFVLRGIKDLGVALAIDDFGTGFSSLTTLASFPFDRLKIDRFFVSGLGNDERLSTVVRACISLARSLDLEVIAEGVETVEQAEALAALDCDQFQGYLYGRPLDAAATRALQDGFDGHAIAARAGDNANFNQSVKSACAKAT